MADPVLTNSASGEAATDPLVTSWGFTATVGRLLVFTMAADDNATGDVAPSGWTQSAEMFQAPGGFFDAYLWWRIADGSETGLSVNLDSAAPANWTVTEWDSINPTPYDISEGQASGSSGSSYTTATITPTTGRRLLIACISGVSFGNVFSGQTTWLNSFTERVDNVSDLSSIRHANAQASRIVDGDGSTTFSTGSTYTFSVGTAADSRGAMIIAFKVATVAAGGVPWLLQSDVVDLRRPTTYRGIT